MTRRLVIIAIQKPGSRELLPNKPKSRSVSTIFGKIIRLARGEAREGKVFSLKQVKQELLGEAAASDKAIQAARSGAKSRRIPSARQKRSRRHSRSSKPPRTEKL